MHIGVSFVSVAYLDVIICGIHLIIMTISGNFTEAFSERKTLLLGYLFIKAK
ncbi:hypothetical protein CE91St58_55600 [Lachnospiraceae bacterium]|nr:hypothetical protein CE91St58_55600 [Lachnospiraceae bacterium]